MKFNRQNKLERVLPGMPTKVCFTNRNISGARDQKRQGLFVCLFVFTLYFFLFLVFVVRISVCYFLVFTVPDPGSRNPVSILGCGH